MKNNEKPDYKRIYSDIIELNFPEKKDDCKKLLNKAELSALEIILLNEKIFGNDKDLKELNQKHTSYQKKDILSILDFQKKNNLSNLRLAKQFNLSRNTIAKWKKLFII